MEDIKSTSNEDKEKMRAEINDFVQALHTMYEVEKMPPIRRLTLLPRDETTKSTNSAIKFKMLADEHFCRGEYEYASLEYTKCLAYAEEGSEEVGHAYANRSAALFKMGKYEQCRLDIDRALNANYPEDKKQKLRERKDRCSSAMAELKARSELDTSEFDQMDAGGSNVSMKEEIDDEWRKRCRDLTNPLIRRTSNKIKLECNETWGRHLVATENIKAGEFLTCERYFTKLVLPGFRYKYCSYCVSGCDALIPCPSCNQAMYCSAYCRARAFNQYHRIECQFFRSTEMREKVKQTKGLALRMLLVGTDQGDGLGTLMRKLTKWDIFAEKIDPTNKPFSSDYLNLLKTCRTFERPFLLNSDSQLGLITKIMIRLQDVGYFHKYPNQHQTAQPQKRLSDTEVFAALLLYNHMVSTRMNTFATTKFVKVKNQQRDILGLGVCILHAMVNHSCDPNAFYLTRYYENVLHSTRPISKGEQPGMADDVHNLFVSNAVRGLLAGGAVCIRFFKITIAYLDVFSRMSREERQEKLSNPLGNYRFTCTCEACVNDWPSFPHLHELIEIFVGTNVRRARHNFNKIVLPVTRNSVSTLSRSELLQLITRLGDWFHTNLGRPSLVTMDGESLMVCCLNYFYDSSRDENASDFLMMKEAENALLDMVKYVDRFWKLL